MLNSPGVILFKKLHSILQMTVLALVLVFTEDFDFIQ